MESKIQEAIKSARDKNKGKIAPSKDIYEAIFKAGEKLSLEKQGQAYLEGKQAGIREVVEWIELNKTHIQGFPVINAQSWDKQLKEWGLK